MQNDYKTNLDLSIKPSMNLRKLIVFIHGLAFVASMINTMVFSIKICLCVLVSIHCWITLKRLSRLSHIKYTEALGWQLSEGQDFVPIDVLNSTVITTKALFLHFNHRSQGNFTKPASKKTLLVLNDALAEEDYRYLIVKLKMTVI
jgi:hypothetical protein